MRQTKLALTLTLLLTSNVTYTVANAAQIDRLADKSISFITEQFDLKNQILSGEVSTKGDNSALTLTIPERTYKNRLSTDKEIPIVIDISALDQDRALFKNEIDLLKLADAKVKPYLNMETKGNGLIATDYIVNFSNNHLESLNVNSKRFELKHSPKINIDNELNHSNASNASQAMKKTDEEKLDLRMFKKNTNASFVVNGLKSEHKLDWKSQVFDYNASIGIESSLIRLSDQNTPDFQISFTDLLWSMNGKNLPATRAQFNRDFINCQSQLQPIEIDKAQCTIDFFKKLLEADNFRAKSLVSSFDIQLETPKEKSPVVIKTSMNTSDFNFENNDGIIKLNTGFTLNEIQLQLPNEGALIAEDGKKMLDELFPKTFNFHFNIQGLKQKEFNAIDLNKKDNLQKFELGGIHLNLFVELISKASAISFNANYNVPDKMTLSDFDSFLSVAPYLTIMLKIKNIDLLIASTQAINPQASMMLMLLKSMEIKDSSVEDTSNFEFTFKEGKPLINGKPLPL